MTNMTETDSDITRDEIGITKGYKSITRSYRRESWRESWREREVIGEKEREVIREGEVVRKREIIRV